jgi:maltokinase
VSAGPQPGVDLPVHLSAVGFTSLPAPLGALWWTSSAGDEVLLATASMFLPGARDGWGWYLDLVLGWLDGAVGDAAALEPADEIGRIAARMHAAFATASNVVPEPIARADDGVADGWRRAAIALADEALACTDGEEGARLAARYDAIRQELDVLGTAGGTVMIHVHGDFHVGQVLEWANGFAVTDLDGDPTVAPAERGVRDTPVRDVAAWVRSIDHLGRVASTRRPGRDEAIERWIAASRAGFLGAYVGELGAAGHADLFDEALLRPLEVVQECHEYVYAARYLPRWRYVPDLAIRAMFPKGNR